MMFVVGSTRARLPSMRVYLRRLGVLLTHWILSALWHFLRTLQLHPGQTSDLLLFPATAPWIALISIPERFLLAWEIYLILLSGLISTKTLRGRPSRRRHAATALTIVRLVGTGERRCSRTWDGPIDRGVGPGGGEQGGGREADPRRRHGEEPHLPYLQETGYHEPGGAC